MTAAASGPQVAVGVVLFDDQGRVLLVQRGQPPAQGRWSVPGGKVERGEPLALACGRELLAETGLAARIGPLCHHFEYIGEGYHYVILDYLACSPQGTLRPGEDAAAARWVTLEEAAGLPTTDGLLPVLRAAWDRWTEWTCGGPKGPR